MIWLIGGPARCGKSTLRRQARPLIDGQVLSWDNLKNALLVIASETDRQEFLMPIHEETNTPQKWVSLLRRRDRVLWKVTKALIESVAQDGENAIMEGNLWPDFVTELAPNLSFRAVFLVDTSPTHAERLIKLARASSTDNNWMDGWSDERLRRWGAYNIERSREIKRLGKEYSQAVFDIADGGLSGAQERALDYLKNESLR